MKTLKEPARHPEEEDMDEQPTGDVIGIVAVYMMFLVVVVLLTVFVGC
jgi:hypothetical protein